MPRRGAVRSCLKKVLVPLLEEVVGLEVREALEAAEAAQAQPFERSDALDWHYQTTRRLK